MSALPLFGRKGKKVGRWVMSLKRAWPGKGAKNFLSSPEAISGTVAGVPDTLYFG
jgi:hypothetical protein